jgi:hypothetical protein
VNGKEKSEKERTNERRRRRRRRGKEEGEEKKKTTAEIFRPHRFLSHTKLFFFWVFLFFSR